MTTLTFRDAIELALEAFPSSMDWAWNTTERLAVRDSVVAWMMDYGRRRGVIFDAEDIESEFDSVVATKRRGT